VAGLVLQPQEPDAGSYWFPVSLVLWNNELPLSSNGMQFPRACCYHCNVWCKACSNGTLQQSSRLVGSQRRVGDTHSRPQGMFSAD